MFRIVELCSVGNGNRSQFVGWLLGVPNVGVGELVFGVANVCLVCGCDKSHTRKTCNRSTLVLECVSSSRETDEVGLESVAKVTHERLDKRLHTC